MVSAVPVVEAVQRVATGETSAVASNLIVRKERNRALLGVWKDAETARRCNCTGSMHAPGHRRPTPGSKGPTQCNDGSEREDHQRADKGEDVDTVLKEFSHSPDTPFPTR